MSVAFYVLAALGLAVLMVVHEGGHYVFARKFGMRVVKFSIGFGPTLWRHQPNGSPTVYQIALIPFLAYVQIAGMNPYETADENDKGSYANASLLGRVLTIAAGPFANYIFASVLFFAGFLIGGRVDDQSMRVSVNQDGPARSADIHNGDRVLAVNDERITNWPQLSHAISAHPGEAIDLLIERGTNQSHIHVTPYAKGEKYEGKILIGLPQDMIPVGVGEAAALSVSEPPKVVIGLVRGLARMIAGKEKPQLSGPVGIVKETAAAAKEGPGEMLKFLGLLSAYLGGFNLLPFPALDGGRLLFLGLEAASRRKPDAKVEARVHAVGLVMMLTLIAFVTWSEVMPKH